MNKINNLKRVFLEHLRRTGLLPKHSRILVALSGGMDSVVLMHLLDTLSSDQNWHIEVAHYHHGIRGEEADEDAAFSEKLAKESGLNFHIEKLPPMPDSSSENWEAFARRHRYEFLEKCRETAGLDWIVTAHHTDDQAETILMKILHGTGVQGLQGIREKVGKIVRPLLPFKRENIEAYAEDNSLLFRHDSTNDDTNYERNFIRHEILTVLGSRFSDYQSGIKILTENVNELEDFLEKELERRRETLVSIRSDGVLCINVDHLMMESAFMRKRLIYHLTNGGDWRGHVWRSLDAFLNSSRTGQMLALPRSWTLLRDRENFLLSQKTLFKADDIYQSFQARDLSMSVGDYKFELVILSESAPFTTDSSEELIDIASIPSNTLQLRGWQPGDRMNPLGLNGSKKVSDILIDRKLDRFAKDRQYVLTSDDEIVWLCGVCLDDRFKVTEKTSRFGRLQWLEENLLCEN
jgi:tRNA(Ile)-lysidine synthase